MVAVRWRCAAISGAVGGGALWRDGAVEVGGRVQDVIDAVDVADVADVGDVADATDTADVADVGSQ